MNKRNERIEEGQLNKENQSRQRDRNQTRMKEDGAGAECRNGQLWGFFTHSLFFFFFFTH